MAVGKILISQTAPNDTEPYERLQEKFGVRIDFQPFYLIEQLSSKELRAQKINIADCTAIVFTARQTIDAFFHLCEELRIKIPMTMKYFCTTEAVAHYLQKHIIYRKRKVFYGDGSPASVLSAVGQKHRGEKFLIATSDTSNCDVMTELFSKAGLDVSSAVFVKSVFQDLRRLDIASYDLIVFYNPADIRSLKENFPAYDRGSTKFVTFGKKIVDAMQEAGLPIEIQAPTPEAPSVAKALERYLSTHA